MPELVSKYIIFLASPSDLSEERDAVNNVINELNISFGTPNRIVLELQKWETHSAPAISSESVQNIINNDIPVYDLFIGLLWMRFGTPTKEYGSGTEEEFNIAYERFIKDNNSIQILFYFKDAPPPSLSDVKPEQLIKVNDFKSSLQEKKILHWEFKLKDDLEKYLRSHIPKRIKDIRNIAIITVNDSICIDLGCGKKALGKRTYNRASNDATKTALAGSELFTVTQTGDDAILATGEFKKLTQPYITTEDYCDCINHIFKT
jgi:hypothetical protein